ncbi:MAG TPA: GtrA family protein [Puia sp.]|nr:GtrA family protein [Puia sp.]
MFTFLKAQAASITATAVDFFVTILLVEVFGLSIVVANVCGIISGAVTHFLISRHWVFEAAVGKIRPQVLKYFLVWIVYLLLNTGLVFLLTSYVRINYIIAKILVASVMSVSYNYFLHKKFVFKQER